MRAERSLIQTIGRAARNVNGKAILYADRVTDSMRRAMDETSRRREKQMAFNEAHGIVPRTIVKQVRDLIDGVYSTKASDDMDRAEKVAMSRAQVEDMSEKEIAKEIKRLEKQMLEAARNLEFEAAAQARDQLTILKQRAFGGVSPEAGNTRGL